MEAPMPSYRLEVAVKRVYGLTPLLASTPAQLAVEVHFLDFPSIVIRPRGYVVGDTITYNVCHKADFRMSAEQAATAFPAACGCQLAADSEGAMHGTARWNCPCYLATNAQAPQRIYVTCAIEDAAGEVVGYAEMSCLVIPTTPAPLPPQQSQHAEQQLAAPPPATIASVVPVPPSVSQPFLAAEAAPVRHSVADSAKPYIVRVVVGESDRAKRTSRAARWGSGVEDVSLRDGPSIRGDGGRAASLRHAPNTASKHSLLWLLQYEVAYQIQSLSETVAAVLCREHDVLSHTKLTGKSTDGAVSIAKLTNSVDQSVAQMVKLANIILQIANQLVEGSPAPARTGTNRAAKDLARQKHNPINKLPQPEEGSIGHYLQYDVLYQLQCLGTNLSYVTLAYHDALDIPLSAIPKQHAEFCVCIEGEIQHLTKLLNIIVQSSVDGILGETSLASGRVTEAEGTKKRHHQDSVAVKVAASAPPPPVASHRPGDSSSSSFSSSDSYSTDSSLNRPLTPPTPQRQVPAPAASPPVVAATTPTPTAAPLPPSQLKVETPAPFTPPPAVAAPMPQQPSFTVPVPLVANRSASPATPTTEMSPQQSFPSMPSVSGPTPFSWVNALQANQQATGSRSSSMPQATLSRYSSGVTGFAPPATLPLVPPPVLGTPPLAVPSPSQSAIPSPTAVPGRVPLVVGAVPLGIPVPVPIPR